MLEFRVSRAGFGLLCGLLLAKVERVRSARQDTPLGRANLPPPIGSLKAEAEKELTHTYSAEAFGDLLLSHHIFFSFHLFSTAYECCLDTR